jgi:hypothetical protein
MEVHNRCSTRRLILCLAVPTGLALMAMLAPSLVAAQGTPQQRAACEDEAKWLCSNYIPDEGAIKACMLRNLKALSPRCRAMFGPPGAKGRKWLQTSCHPKASTASRKRSSLVRDRRSRHYRKEGAAIGALVELTPSPQGSFFGIASCKAYSKAGSVRRTEPPKPARSMAL